MVTKFNFSDSDDFEDDENEFKFGKKVENNLKDFEQHRPLFSYRYLDLKYTSYHFHQECFDNIDIRTYFAQLKEFSNLTIEQCINSKGDKFHFRLERPSSKLLSLIQDIAQTNVTQDNCPVVGHFGLYTDKNGANRDTNVKSPRIFFILYAQTIYPLLYDPYHEIHQRKG